MKTIKCYIITYISFYYISFVAFFFSFVDECIQISQIRHSVKNKATVNVSWVCFIYSYHIGCEAGVL